MSPEKTDSINISIEELLEQFSSGSSRIRRSLIKSVESRAEEIASLGSVALNHFDSDGDDWGAGWILQVLKRHQPEGLIKLISNDSKGWFAIPSEVGIDYGAFQNALLSECFWLRLPRMKSLLQDCLALVLKAHQECFEYVLCWSY